MEKLNILDNETYNNVVNFIGNYNGLPIDCELELRMIFQHIDEKALSSIVFSEWVQKSKVQIHKTQMMIPALLNKFEEAIAKNFSETILIEMAIKQKISPSALGRFIIQEKYKDQPKGKITEMIKNPSLIPDENLAMNLRTLAFSDNQEGPIVDILRRCLGEEYEVKLKQMALEVGMTFFDEGDLRRTGYDKTPDLKLALPCLYKGAVVNWIESKALFGDLKTHRRYLREQLTSYTNRFGPGIVIYWFGYLEDIKFLKENGDGLIISNTFPSKADLEFLKV